jgi:methionyl-tRNA synthetase
MSKFFITTAIDYVNGKPHLGHAYEKVMTDVIARYRRSKGDEVFFLTGTDEHGQKIQQGALKEGMDTLEYCTKYSTTFQNLCKSLNISNDKFIRTTDADHKKVVSDILQKVYDSGDIYKADYNGYYSVKEEQFLTEKERDENGNFPAAYGEVVELKESNYFFKLSKYQAWLVEFLEKTEGFLYPEFRQREVLGKLKDPIPDLCISRPKSRLNWGIELPFDKDQVTYVWFDALINYITGIKYGSSEFIGWWDNAHHVIGKDIVAPPHAIYWPIMLHAMGVQPPKQIIAHGWWTVDGQKMSKSFGNGQDPMDLIEKFGPDVFRYFVMREMAIGQDADFSLAQFEQRYGSDLGNDVGNLLNRTVSMIKRYNNGVVPAAVDSAREALDDDLEAKVLEAIQDFDKGMQSYQIHIGIQNFWKGFNRLNQYVEENAPWKLAKDETKKERLNYVLNQLASGIALLAKPLGVVMPTIAEKINEQVGLKNYKASFDVTKWDRIPEGTTVGEAQVLFPRFEKEEAAKA